MSIKTSRRDFLKVSTIAGAGFMVGAGNTVKLARASALQGVAVAGIGVGGKALATSNTPVSTATSSRSAISTKGRSKVKRKTSNNRSATKTIAICTPK